MSSAAQMNRRVGFRESAPRRGASSLTAIKAAVREAAQRADLRADQPTSRITVRAVLKEGRR